MHACMHTYTHPSTRTRSLSLAHVYIYMYTFIYNIQHEDACANLKTLLHVMCLHSAISNDVLVLYNLKVDKPLQALLEFVRVSVCSGACVYVCVVTHTHTHTHTRTIMIQ